MLNRKCVLAICLVPVLASLIGFSLNQEGQDFCCERNALFVPVAMPAEQEYDAWGMIYANIFRTLRKFRLLDCPIEYEQISWEGRIELDEMDEAIGKVTGGKTDPEAREAVRKLLDVEYIWKGTLTLDRIDEIKPGYWEEGYLGEKNYVPQEALGDWTLHMKLVNVHFDEVLKEGRASWSGKSQGSEMDRAVKNMVRTVFSPVDDIIFDYEHIPWSCEVKSEKDEISVGDSMSITIKDIKDSKGREPKPWQRIAVKLEKGEITNGVKMGEEKLYAFLVGDGEVEMEYKAPEDCEKSGTEKVTIYNSCNWGQEWMKPLRVTPPQKEIGDDDFEITCNWEGMIASTYGFSAKGDEALLTAIAPKSQYQGITNWKLDVIFKLARGNERVRIYELKSAKFNFSSTSEHEWTMEKKEGKIQTGGNWAAEEGRELGPSECDLELIIDLKKKTYKIEGLLHVKNIKEKADVKLDIDLLSLHGGQKESDEQTMEHREEILIEGEFSGDSPKKFEGNLDEMRELPPEFVELMEGMAGEIKGTIRWKLEQKGKH